MMHFSYRRDYPFCFLHVVESSVHPFAAPVKIAARLGSMEIETDRVKGVCHGALLSLIIMQDSVFSIFTKAMYNSFLPKCNMGAGSVSDG